MVSQARLARDCRFRRVPSILDPSSSRQPVQLRLCYGLSIPLSFAAHLCYSSIVAFIVIRCFVVVTLSLNGYKARALLKYQFPQECPLYANGQRSESCKVYTLSFSPLTPLPFSYLYRRNNELFTRIGAGETSD